MGTIIKKRIEFPKISEKKSQRQDNLPFLAPSEEQFFIQKGDENQSHTLGLRTIPYIPCYISAFLCDLADLLTCSVFNDYYIPKTLNMFLLSLPQ